MVAELEQKKKGHNDFFKPLLRGRITYVQPCPREDCFSPFVYKCNAWVSLLTIVFCFSNKEFFISFEVYLFILSFYLFDCHPALCTRHFRNSTGRIGCQYNADYWSASGLVFSFLIFSVFNLNFFAPRLSRSFTLFHAKFCVASLNNNSIHHLA